MHTHVSRVGFLIAGPLIGFVVGIAASLLFHEYYWQDLYGSIIYSSFIVCVCVMGGIAIPGYFYCMSINQKKDFPVAVGYSVVGLLLFVLLSIALFMIEGLIKESTILSAFSPLISLLAIGLPFIGAQIGFLHRLKKRKTPYTTQHQ